MDMQSDMQKTDIMTIIQSDRKIIVIKMEIQSDIQISRHKDGHTIRHANKQTERRASNLTDRKTDI